MGKYETALTSYIHSFQPSIKRQTIMLPLHGQDTAAVNNTPGRTHFLFIHQEAMFLLNSRAKICRIPYINIILVINL